MRNSQQMWLITKDGKPVDYSWANHKTEDDCQTEDERRNWSGCALTSHQPVTEGWDAQPTLWRRVPDLLYPTPLKTTGAVLEGRYILSIGCKWCLDDTGRPSGTTEPHAPDPEIVDMEVLLVAAEEVFKKKIEVYDKTAKRRVYVNTPEGFQLEKGCDMIFRTADGRALRASA